MGEGGCELVRRTNPCASHIDDVGRPSSLVSLVGVRDLLKHADEGKVSDQLQKQGCNLSQEETG